MEVSVELNCPGKVGGLINNAAFVFGDDWGAKVDNEFVAELAAIAVEVNRKKSHSEKRM